MGREYERVKGKPIKRKPKKHEVKEYGGGKHTGLGAAAEKAKKKKAKKGGLPSMEELRKRKAEERQRKRKQKREEGTVSGYNPNPKYRMRKGNV